MDPILFATTVCAPPGTRIHTLSVQVKLDRPWEEAVFSAGTNIGSRDNPRKWQIPSVWKVGDLYLPTGTGEVCEELILFNYTPDNGSWLRQLFFGRKPTSGGTWFTALAWAASLGLKRTVPREVFAVAEQHPTLPQTLGVDSMTALATTECTFNDQRQACGVWWGGPLSTGALLTPISSAIHPRVWFAFKR